MSRPAVLLLLPALARPRPPRPLVRARRRADRGASASCWLSGGRMPDGVAAPAGVELVLLPPLGMGTDGVLVSRDERRGPSRPSRTPAASSCCAPRRAAPRRRAGRAVPVRPPQASRASCCRCSRPRARPGRHRGLQPARHPRRAPRRDQAAHDERAATIANAFFDAVLVHADPRFARLEESFRPSTPLRVPVHYTGFVAPAGRGPPRPAPRRRERARRRLGRRRRVGGDLLRAAVEAPPARAGRRRASP